MGEMPATRSGVLKGILARTIILVIVLFVFYYIFGVLLANVGSVKLGFIILPVFVAVIAMYAASMLELILVWRYAKAVASAIRTVGLIAFVGLLLASLPAQMNIHLEPVAPILIIFGISYAAGQVLAVDGGYRLILYRTLPILLLGLVLRQTWLCLAPADPGVNIPLYGMIVTAALSLLALLKDNSNPIASGVGHFFYRTSNLALVGGVGTFVILYFVSIRPALIKAMPDQVILIEWGIVVLIAFLVARRFLAYFKQRSSRNEMAEWTQLVQYISRNKGEVERTSNIVRAFVENGRKEPLLAYLSILLGREGFDEIAVASVIEPLVRYREEEPPPTLRWLLGDVQKARKEQRSQVVRKCMERSGLSPRLGTEVRTDGTQ
jgi:hypothetical protein